MTYLKKRNLLCLTALVIILLSANRALAQSEGDTVTPSNETATGHSFYGVDLGITGTTYLGNRNFLWPIDPVNGLRTYVPFRNLGFGVGFLGGLKVAASLSDQFDLEWKARWFSNHTSRTENTDNIELDPYRPAALANSKNEYSLTMYNVGGAMLGHYRLDHNFYAALGVDASAHMGNSLTASQQLSGGNSYLRTDTHTQSFTYSQERQPIQMVNFFNGVRAGVDVGAGTTTRFGASNYLFDAELLVSIPFTTWVQKTGQNLFKQTTDYYANYGTLPFPEITYPHQWYATLTVGVRFPFHKLPPPIPQPVLAVKQVDTSLHVTAEVKQDTSGRVELSGHVTDAQTGKPIQADLTTVDLGNNQVISKIHADSNGAYHVTVDKPGKYSVTAQADGYLFGSAYFEVDSAGRILKSNPDIKLSGISNGRIRLLVFFEFDKAELQPSSSPELNRAVELMKAMPALKVEIAGYTDSVGTRAHNMDLSMRRANAVRDFLVQNGVAGDRVISRGYGPEMPIAPNETDEGRAENRRVEFVVVNR